MDEASLWGYAHILFFVIWLATDLRVYVLMARIKNAARSFEDRKGLVRRVEVLRVIPQMCFALILPTGVELTGAINVYPLTPGLRAASWIVGLVWLAVIVTGAGARGRALGANLRIVELVFELFAGLVFVAYGLNSLATGAPIDDPWFAAKLFLFGLVFWTSVAADIGFRPFYAPFYEIAVEGSIPDREEGISAAVNHTLVAIAASLVLIAVIAFIGRVKPF